MQIIQPNQALRTESGSEVLLFGWILLDLDLAHPTKQSGKSGTVYIKKNSATMRIDYSTENPWKKVGYLPLFAYRMSKNT